VFVSGKKLVVVVPRDVYTKTPGCVFGYVTHRFIIQHPGCYMSGTFSNSFVKLERGS